MSSPFRSSPQREDDTPRSSPSRQLLHTLNGQARGPSPNQTPPRHHHHRRSHQTPNLNSTTDKINNEENPSNQLLEEFSLLLLADARSFSHTLNQQAASQERLHRLALERSYAYHEAVRQKAERARERLELELEAERRRRETEEKRELERTRREFVEREKREQSRLLDEAKERERESLEREALRREREALEQKAEADKQRELLELQAKREAVERKERVEKKAREDAAALERAQRAASRLLPPAPEPRQQSNGILPHAAPIVAPSPASRPTAPTTAVASPAPPGLMSSIQEREAIHHRYLDLHKRLKQVRRYVETECAKQGKQVKEQLSDWRRKLKMYCGQQNKTDKEANKKAMERIREILDRAALIPEPSVDVSALILYPNQDPSINNTPPPSKHGSGILIFLLSHLSKSLIQQFLSESAVDPLTAEPLGILAATFFARPQLLFHQQSLIDILWAKFHRVAPLLFGISGDENTSAGRLRMGWWQEEQADTFIPQQRHYERLTGLAAGFSALTLRDFSKARSRANPAPNRLWWEAVARIVNTPPAQRQGSHYVVLKALLGGNNVPRVIGLWGHAGLVALRLALVEFVKDGPKDKQGRLLPPVRAVQALPAVLAKELGLTLE